MHKIIDTCKGNHHICKIIAVKVEILEYGIHSERAFRARVEMEVNLVKQAQPHVSSLFLQFIVVMLTIILG